jgi:hypothetical protein
MAEFLALRADVAREGHGIPRGAAPCADHSDLFFAPLRLGDDGRAWAEPRAVREERERLAKAICASCAFLAPCRDYVLRANEPAGIWGGLTEDERGVRRARTDRQRELRHLARAEVRGDLAGAR